MAEVATTSFDVRDNDERMVNERLYEIYGTNNQNGKRSDIMQHNDVSPIHTSFLFHFYQSATYTTCNVFSSSFILTK